MRNIFLALVLLVFTSVPSLAQNQHPILQFEENGSITALTFNEKIYPIESNSPPGSVQVTSWRLTSMPLNCYSDDDPAKKVPCKPVIIASGGLAFFGNVCEFTISKRAAPQCSSITPIVETDEAWESFHANQFSCPAFAGNLDEVLVRYIQAGYKQGIWLDYAYSSLDSTPDSYIILIPPPGRRLAILRISSDDKTCLSGGLLAGNIQFNP